MNVEGKSIATADAARAGASLPDHWIRSRFSRALATVHAELAAYRFDLAARALYEFTWNEYCDWYLELTKPILQGAGSPEAQQAATRRTLIDVLEALLRALHPLIPFITEELWQRVGAVAGVRGATIMLQPYPDAASFATDEHSEAELGWLQGFVLGIRQIRGEMDIAPAKPLPVLLQDASPADRERAATHEHYLRQLARLESLRMLAPGEEPPVAATALLGGTKLLVPMAGLIDVGAERERLEKALVQARGDLARVEGKLANRQFAENAPAAVVEKEREKERLARQEITQLDEQLARLARLG
jgi:valyl-tRNA synthetase